MVYCGAVAATRAATAATGATATALGLGMGKTDLDLTRDLFKYQMRQTKRLWTAEWAESSFRHGESLTQNAQQHAEAQAMAAATYYQAEKLATQQIKLARDQDSRSYEISWRSEVRESLRDELANQNNRFNIIMLCDTVCLSCVFTLIADGTPADDTSTIVLNSYVLCLALSIMLFTISMWCSVIVVRRLHEHTASTLERKLFAQCDDLQSAWKQQLRLNMPTDRHILHLVDQAYDRWVDNYINPLGQCSIHMLSIGVVTMFFTAGILTQSTYLHEFDAPTAVWIFWGAVIFTSSIIIYMKSSEDMIERKKEGVYDNSWQDNIAVAVPTTKISATSPEEDEDETGPFAKINRASKSLFSSETKNMATNERMQELHNHEKIERDYCAKTKSLHKRVQSLREEAEERAQRREEIIKLLTTAAEEFDAIPEDLTSKLNKILFDIDEADRRTSDYILTSPESIDCLESVASMRSDWSRLPRPPPRKPMSDDPIDAQRAPVTLSSLRTKLGDIALTTLLRIQNLSEEPLRLKSGLQMKEGRYVNSLNATDRLGDTVRYSLYPITEIPPRTEVVIVARCTTAAGIWIPTSRIEGQIVYTNRDETWFFRINFTNGFMSNRRDCSVRASSISSPTNNNGGGVQVQQQQQIQQQYPHPTNNKVVSGGTESETVVSDVFDEDIEIQYNNGGHHQQQQQQQQQQNYYPQKEQTWQISKSELDRKANNEIVISIDNNYTQEGRRSNYQQQQNMRRRSSAFRSERNLQ